MKTSELIRILKEHGCYLHEEGGNHSRYYSPITGKYFSVGRHGSKEVAVGTANRILKDAGIKK
jgi:predicted RNA binding protein YcfA (HicA-like mRNA interferase family)